MMMVKTKHNPPSALETKANRDKLEIQWEKFDRNHFPKGLNAKLAAGTNHALTSCTTSVPDLTDKIVQAHHNESADHTTPRLQTKGTSKREQDSKRAITQAEATARFK